MSDKGYRNRLYNINQEASESEENLGKMDRVCEVGTNFSRLEREAKMLTLLLCSVAVQCKVKLSLPERHEDVLSTGVKTPRSKLLSACFLLVACLAYSSILFRNVGEFVLNNTASEPR
jgi:hypothetical protein